MRRTLLFLPLAAALGCSPKPVTYEAPERVETLTPGYGATDLQYMVESLATQLLASEWLLSEPEPPIVMIGKVQNKSTEHVDLNTLARMLRARLLQSGKVRFAARDDIQKAPENLRKELEFQQESGMVNPATAKEIGQVIGAGYYLTGFMDSIVKKAGGRQDAYFLFILEIVDLETWKVVTTQEVEIRKVSQRAVIGL